MTPISFIPIIWQRNLSWEKFAESFIDEPTLKSHAGSKKHYDRKRHKAFQPDTMAHKQFLKTF
jgi:hypothetical protein